VSLPAPVVNDTRMSAGASRRGFDHPETGAGALRQRHSALLIGIELQRVESVGRGADRWHLKRKGS
jgi:hypothetical protein